MNQEIQIYVIISSSIRMKETSPAEAYTHRKDAEARMKELAEAFNGWNTFTVESIPLDPKFG
jgi:hypothetical protein